ncbi:hypothetical protein, partial [Prevotella aurantiaca]|uniref:hypothetical protein n=1 Tax=Prevotella aurantiaca TaxID=596085 RepID=UPI0023548688
SITKIRELFSLPNVHYASSLNDCISKKVKVEKYHYIIMTHSNYGILKDLVYHKNFLYLD